MTQALKGIRVIDMSHVIAGPLASMYLTQFGAEVIKVEPPTGEVMRQGQPSSFAPMNAGKRSLSVDIRQPEGAELIRKLAHTADVFIENFRPGTVARHGLAYDDIRAIKPDIVYCSLSGYGQQGAWAERGAYDHVIQALTGMMMVSGDGDRDEPLKVGFPAVDVAAGMLGALSICAALLRRSASGEGEYIDVSMAQAALMLMYPKVNSYLTEGDIPKRVGNKGYTGSPGADTFACTDGWISTAANTPSQFQTLLEVLGRSDLGQNAELIDTEALTSERGFVKARQPERLRQQLVEAFAHQSAHDLEERLNALGVPAARVRTLDGFLDETIDRDRIQLPSVRYAAGDKVVRTAGLGFHLQAEPIPAEAAVASLGSSNDALLKSLGLTPHEVKSLRQRGIVG